MSPWLSYFSTRSAASSACIGLTTPNKYTYMSREYDQSVLHAQSFILPPSTYPSTTIPYASTLTHVCVGWCLFSIMQKTWSNDSLSSQLLPPSSSLRRVNADVDKPRRHARRTSLPVRNSEDGEIHRQSSERRRFRESIATLKKKQLADSRRQSAPTGSRPAGLRKIDSNGRRRPMFGVGEEEGDDEDEGEDEDEVIETDDAGRYTSAIDSSVTYAAGPSSSGGRRALDEDGSSSDASSSGHAFDWDVPANRRSTFAPPSRLLDDAWEQISAPYRRTHQQTTTHQNGDTPPTPTQRRKELEPVEDSGQNGSHSPATRLSNGKATHSSGERLESATTASKGHACATRSLWHFPSNPTIEASLLVLASVIVAIRLGQYPDEATRTHAWELLVLVIASSAFYTLSRHEEKRTIWATSLRQYRACGDDGVMCGLLLGPLLAVTLLFASLSDRPSYRSASGDGLPLPPWRVETPALTLGQRSVPHPTMTALALSRCTLLSLQTAMATTLLTHLVATTWYRRPHQITDGSWKRLWSYVKFSVCVSLVLTVFREAFAWIDIPLWTGLTRMELLSTTLAFQGTLYTIAQLARRSFTLGELAVVACVGVTLSVETINLMSAKLMPGSTPFVKTFRRPTPLLIFQLALVVGTFMIGFLLSPLLYLSRHLAQKPVHRLRWPHKRDLHRRLLAFFFYLFAALFVAGVLGLWVYWMLNWKSPWIWTMKFVVNGARWWSRPLLVVFWLALITSSIVGWQATVLNGKRFRIRTGPKPQNATGSSSTGSTAQQAFSPAHMSLHSAADDQYDSDRKTKGSISASGSGDLSAHTNARLFHKRAAYLSLNARRKSFHALAVLLFVPGIAFDPAFTHLAFSLAFSVFIFAEYVRYYALYPFGAALHVFLSEFTDHKDSGPVILSHFYLLTGCAGGLWIEGLHGTSTRAGMNLSQQLVDSGGWNSNGKLLRLNDNLWSSVLGTFGWSSPSSFSAVPWSGGGHVDISMFIGVLTLGIGDALASIVGRRYGRVRWPKSGKTLEGSVAFIASIYASALLLRALGWCSPFPLLRFAAVSVILGLVEGISNQNDNLVLPIYGVIALSVLQV